MGDVPEFGGFLRASRERTHCVAGLVIHVQLVPQQFGATTFRARAKIVGFSDPLAVIDQLKLAQRVQAAIARVHRAIEFEYG